MSLIAPIQRKYLHPEVTIKSSEFTLGPFMEKFETSLSRYVGAKYCIATNNGTDALILSLKALNIKDRDEVITPANSFYATTGAIVAVGATPVFCDVDNNYQILIDDIASKITKKTKVYYLFIGVGHLLI